MGHRTVVHYRLEVNGKLLLGAFSVVRGAYKQILGA